MRKGATKKLIEEALHGWRGAGAIKAYIHHSISIPSVFGRETLNPKKPASTTPF
jgi:hypothetical protein